MRLRYWIGIVAAVGDYLLQRLREWGVEQLFGDTALDVGTEVRTVQREELGGRGVVAENALVDGLEEEAGGDGVERGVVFDVLEGDLNDRLVELLGGDAIEEGELEL